MKKRYLHYISALLLSANVYAAPSAYQAPLAAKSLLLDVVRADSGLVAVGERGHILLSVNGDNWQQAEVPTTATLTAVTFIDQQGWAVGHDSIILHTADSGHHWQVQQYLPELEQPLMDVLFVNAMQGIAVGAYGNYFRTEDGGEHWQKELHPEFLMAEDREYLEDIKAQDPDYYEEAIAGMLPHLNRLSFDGSRLYLAGEAGLLAYSDDLGKSWQRMEIDYNGSFFDVRKAEDGQVYAAGLRGHLFRLDGQTWQEIESGTQASLNSIVPLSSTETLAVGNNGMIVTIQGDKVTASQEKDGKAIVDGVSVNGRLLAVTATGIKQF